MYVQRAKGAGIAALISHHHYRHRFHYSILKKEKHSIWRLKLEAMHPKYPNVGILCTCRVAMTRV